MLRFEVQCNTVPGEQVAVCGTGPLGCWEVSKGLVLDAVNYPIWSGEVAAGSDALEFKYAIVRRPEGGGSLQLVRWEGDFPNRKADPTGDGAERIIVGHRFGDPSYAAVELTMAQAAPPAKEESAAAKAKGDESGGGYAASDTPKTSDSTPAAKSGKDALLRKASDGGVLSKLEVEPSVRLTRLIRSKSGDAFGGKYELKSGKVLGTGMSGGVVVAITRSNGQEVAVKTLMIDDTTKVDQIKAEIEHQLNMDHPNICRLFEVYEEPDRFLLVMERLKGCDLFDHLKKKVRYTENDAIDCVRQICSAVAYCHRHSVCHRDLKLENFCMEDDSDNARIKMIDFGLSSRITALPMTDACGTLYYVAPEVLKGHYDQKCDMWSLGVLTYVLLDGRAPFAARDDRQTYQLIRKGQYSFGERWSSISRDAQDFVSSLLRVDPQARLSAEEALAHSWLTAPPADASVVLDTEVLDGLRTFSRGNDVKRAILRALAPLATINEVGRWADQFEALDSQGTGRIQVADLAQSLAKHVGDKEAEQLSEALKLASDDSEEISYSAFLAACLSAHHSESCMGEDQIKALFAKLDEDKTGKVSAEQVQSALGDVVDMDSLEGEFGSRNLSYTDFQWLLQKPQMAPESIAGLRQLLGAFEGLSPAKSWRVDTVKAKFGDDTSIEATRRENAAWRKWNKQLLHGEADELTDSPGSEALPAQKSDSSLAKSATGAEGRSKDKALLTVPYTADSLPDAEDKKSEAGSQAGNLADEEDAAQAAWAVATKEAKDGEVDAIRRENLNWRKLHMSQSQEPG